MGRDSRFKSFQGMKRGQPGRPINGTGLVGPGNVPIIGQMDAIDRFGRVLEQGDLCLFFPNNMAEVIWQVVNPPQAVSNPSAPGGRSMVVMIAATFRCDLCGRAFKAVGVEAGVDPERPGSHGEMMVFPVVPIDEEPHMIRVGRG